MIQTNIPWDAKNVLLAKKPIYVFTVGEEARVYSTHDLTAEGITGTLPEFRAWLKTPRGASQSIDVLNGTSSIGELELEVIDQGGEMRYLVGTETLEGRSATLSVGYPGIAYSEFVTLHSYQICKITPSRGYTSWIFRARDRQMNAKRTVWQNPERGDDISTESPWILMGTPGEILQAVYLLALERPASEVDRAGLVALDSAAEGIFKAVRPFLFVLTEAFEGKQFLESEVYKASGCYPLIDNLGRIVLRSGRPPAAGPSGAYALTDDNIIVLPEIDRMPIVNEIVFKLDYSGGQAQTEIVYIDATSVSTYGRAGQHVIDSKGLRTEYGAQWWCQEVAARIFRRFAGTPGGLRGGAPVYRVEAFFLSLPIWVGDYVTVTHPLIPDILTGELGITDRLMEVIDREPDYAAGRMRYRLLDTGITGLEAAHKFGPSDRDFIIETSEVY